MLEPPALGTAYAVPQADDSARIIWIFEKLGWVSSCTKDLARKAIIPPS